MSTQSLSSGSPTPREALVARLWPDHGSRVSRAIALIMIGTALLTFSAKINIPLPLVPMTLQTLAVLMIGMSYGPRLGGLTLLAYLAEGALGLPVFAGPVGGLAPMMGPTGGYLAGFLVAAILTGVLAERGWDRSIGTLFLAMLIGHAVILAAGFLWLAGVHLGASKAWAAGVTPFLAGSVVKSGLGAALLLACRRVADRPAARP